MAWHVLIDYLRSTFYLVDPTNNTTGLINRNEPISTSVAGTVFARHGYSTTRQHYRPQERPLRQTINRSGQYKWPASINLINRSGRHNMPATVNAFTVAGSLRCPLRLTDINRSRRFMLTASVVRWHYK